MKMQTSYTAAINNNYRGNTSFSFASKGAASELMAQKQHQAQEKATGIIKRAFASEKKLDDNVNKHKMRVASLESDIRQNNEEIKLISEKQKELKSFYQGLNKKLQAEIYAENDVRDTVVDASC